MPASIGHHHVKQIFGTQGMAVSTSVCRGEAAKTVTQVFRMARIPCDVSVAPFRVEKNSKDVRLMKPPSPELRTPDTQEQEKEDLAPQPSTSECVRTEPDTTASSNSHETVDLLAQSLR